MQYAEKNAILSIKGGRYSCPVCGKGFLQRADRATIARDLPLYCTKCKREFIVDIDHGQGRIKSQSR